MLERLCLYAYATKVDRIFEEYLAGNRTESVANSGFLEFSARPSLFHVISAMMTETDSRSVREGGEEALSRAPIAIAASGNKRLTSILQKTRSSGKYQDVERILYRAESVARSMRIGMDAQSTL